MPMKRKGCHVKLSQGEANTSRGYIKSVNINAYGENHKINCY